MVVVPIRPVETQCPFHVHLHSYKFFPFLDVIANSACNTQLFTLSMSRLSFSTGGFALNTVRLSTSRGMIRLEGLCVRGGYGNLKW